MPDRRAAEPQSSRTEDRKFRSSEVQKFRSTVLLRYYSQKGFTLLEILISVAIISIVLTALYSSFFMSKKAVDSLDDNLIRLQEMRMTLDVMRREVESAFLSPERPYTIFKIDSKDFYGKEASSIMFTAFSHHTPGSLRLSYFVEGENETTMRLMKSVSTKVLRVLENADYVSQNIRSENKLDSEQHGNTEPLEILDDIESFTVEAGYRGEWVKTWDSNLSHDVPEEVRFTIVVNVKGKRYALSDVAKIRTGRML